MSKRSRITGITGPVTIDKWQPNTWKFLGKRLKNGKFLYGRNEKVTYPEATDICSNMGLQMALPESSYENEQELISIFFSDILRGTVCTVQNKLKNLRSRQYLKRFTIHIGLESEKRTMMTSHIALMIILTRVYLTKTGLIFKLTRTIGNDLPYGWVMYYEP